MNLHNPPSNITDREIESLFDCTPYREVFIKYGELLRTRVENEQKDSPEMKRILRDKEIIDEQLYFARELIREIEKSIKYMEPRYKETKELIAGITRVIEDSQVEL